MKTPKRVRVFGQWVKVVVAPREQVTLHGGGEVDGCYVEHTHTIYLCDDLQEDRMAYIYRHEMIHAQFRIAGVSELIESHFDAEGAERFEEAAVRLLTAAGARK